MSGRETFLSLFKQCACLGILSVLLCGTGCQVNVGGQTLPSPFYLDDDVQYFAPGPELPLSNEAAAQGIRRAEDGDLEE